MTFLDAELCTWDAHRRHAAQGIARVQRPHRRDFRDRSELHIVSAGRAASPVRYDAYRPLLSG
jgi:hypothetical protein